MKFKVGDLVRWDNINYYCPEGYNRIAIILENDYNVVQKFAFDEDEDKDIIVYMLNEEIEEERLAYNPKFMVVSIYENSDEWFYEYPEKNNLKVVQAYTLDGQRPSLVIYQMRP